MIRSILWAILALKAFLPSMSTIIGNDPWYSTSSHYWSFNQMDGNKHIMDITGYRKSRVYGGADIIKGVSKNALQLDGLLSTGANLGNFSTTCLSEPLNCKRGFSVAFWMKLDTKNIEDDSYQVIFQVSRMQQSIGTTFYAKKEILGLSVNDKNLSRTVEITWNTTEWSHLTLSWNKVKGSVNIFLNCKGNKVIKNKIARNMFYMVPPQNQMWLGSNYALMKNCRLAIDELAIWYVVLSVQEICYLHKVKAVDGGFSPWSNFTSCSVTCGLGTKTRTRTCTNPPPQHGGSDCVGPHNETLNCFLRECPIDGNYTMWSAFSSCSKSCGGGERKRFRTCTNPQPLYDGKNCSRYGGPVDILACNTQHCPINGGLSQWSNYTSCSVSCGDGMRTRNRSCTNPPPQYGGKDCSKFDATLETKYCFLKICPVDGNYSNWNPFSVCSRSCGGGNQSRERQCNNPTPVGDGRNCSHLGPSFETRLCNTQECPVNGGYTPWSSFSNCSKVCGGGVRIRTRDCTNPPPAYGGIDCSRLGYAEETQICNDDPCPVDGGFGDWSIYSACSVSCGGGKRKRTRSCDNPMPAYGGKNCSSLGPSMETMACNTQKCPDIVFLTVVRFLEEEFQPFLYNRESEKFQRFRRKIENNVKNVFGPTSAFDGLEIICEPGISKNNRPSGIQCKLELQFSSGGYDGIVDLQDALHLKGMLGTMPVETSYLISSDVPTDYKGLNVQVYNVSAQSLNVTWSLSDKREKEDVQGYRLVYTDETNNKYSTIVQGRDTSHVELKHLKIYHFYCIRLLPFNSRGDGLATYPVCAYTDLKIPGDFPKNLSAHQMNNDSVLITWDHLSKDLHNGDLLGYALRYHKVNNTHHSSIAYKRKNISPATNEYVFDEFGGFALFKMQIAAFNKKGVGEWSDELEFYTAEDVPGKAPLIQTAYNTSSSSVYISWYPIPKQYHNGRLLGYRIFYKDVTMRNDSHYDNITLGPDVDRINITGLRKYKTYVVQVAGFNNKGEGAPSKGVLVTTDQDVPSQPPAQVTVANTSSTSLIVQWSPVPKNGRNGDIIGYKIQYKRSGSNEPIVTKCCIPETSAADLESLRKFTKYDVQIQAYTVKGDGPLSDVVIATTAEDIPSKPPTFLSLYNTSSTSLRVTWLAIPARYVHGILLGYRVLYRSINVTKEKYEYEEVGPDSLEVVLKGLLKYMDYGIRVLGFTKVGLGTVSNEVIVRTDQDVPSWPPENVVAINKTSPTKISLKWQPISNQYFIHGILLGYKVIYRAVRNPDEFLNGPRNVIVLAPGVHSLTITNLTSYTIYSVEVLAFTVKGDGVTSNAIHVETCNCHRWMYSNWWSNPPYTNKYNISGIFPSLLKMLTKTCCGQCLEHTKSEIKFDFVTEHSYAVKRDENVVRGDIEDDSEISFPITGRYGQMTYNDHAFVPLVESGGTVFMTIVDEPGMMASMVVMQVFKLWPMCMAVFVSAFFAGIVMWILDTLFNSNEFPRSPFRGILEGMWWAFITMTTLGYGDRIPKAFHSKSFGIVWITCGLVIVALFMSLITASLTTNVMGSEKMVYGSKVAALRNSSEFRLGIRLNGIMDQEAKYDDLRDIYKALKKRKVDGILVDAYTAGSRKDLFGDEELRITKIISHSSVYGVVLGGHAKRLQSCYRSFLKEERVRVFGVITKHVEQVEASPVTSSDMTADLFDAESYVFRQAITWTCILFGVFAVVFLVYELLTRKKRKPNPSKHDFSDKNALLPLIYLQDNTFLSYTETKQVMLAVVKEFYVSCNATSKKLREKHARELRLLYRMKEQAEHPEQKEKSGEKKTLFEEARKAFWRIVSGALPPSSNQNAAV